MSALRTALNPEVLFFDFDGTLVDNFQAIYAAYVYVAQQLGHRVADFATLKRSVGGSIAVTFQKLFEKEDTQAETQLYQQYFPSVMHQGVQVIDGVVPFLDKCLAQKRRMAIFTNKHAGITRQLCQDLGLQQYFEHIIGSGDTPFRKPQAEFSWHALHTMQAQPASSILVGDSPFDAQAAQAVHMPAWLVATGTHTLAELHTQAPGAQHYASSLHELALHLG
jgi:phosphoglycolate phosphatase